MRATIAFLAVVVVATVTSASTVAAPDDMVIPWPQSGFSAGHAGRSAVANGLPVPAPSGYELWTGCLWSLPNNVNGTQSTFVVGPTNWGYSVQYLANILPGELFPVLCGVSGVYNNNGGGPCPASWCTPINANDYNPYLQAPVLAPSGLAVVYVTPSTVSPNSGGGVVTGADPLTGDVVWRAADAYRSDGVLVVASGLVWTCLGGSGGGNGSCFAVDAHANGEVVHTLLLAPKATSNGYTLVGAVADPLSAPAGSAAFFVIGHTIAPPGMQALYALDLTGAIVWSIQNLRGSAVAYTLALDEPHGVLWLSHTKGGASAVGYALTNGAAVVTLAGVTGQDTATEFVVSSTGVVVPNTSDQNTNGLALAGFAAPSAAAVAAAEAVGLTAAPAVASAAWTYRPSCGVNWENGYLVPTGNASSSIVGDAGDRLYWSWSVGYTVPANGNATCSMTGVSAVDMRTGHELQCWSDDQGCTSAANPTYAWTPTRLAVGSGQTLFYQARQYNTGVQEVGFLTVIPEP